MAERLLVFGGFGFVGGVIAQNAVLRGWAVAAADGKFRAGLEQVAPVLLDITDKDEVRRAIVEFGADAVVNTAAISNIDLAQREKKLAWAVNVEGARNIAEACAVKKIAHVFFSSDAVFSGKEKGYTEQDETGPVNYYGQTKVEAEKAVLAAWARSAVLRISLVLGFPATGGNSFLAGLKEKLAKGDEIACATDEYRTPIDVDTLAEVVLEILGGDFSGLLHVGSTGSINRYELTREAAELMGFDSGLVIKAKTSADGPSKAPRHKNGIIDVTKATRLLNTKMLSVDETIARQFMAQRGIEAMKEPKIVKELEVAHGSIYGKEEEAALIECLRNRAPSCGKKVKEFEEAFAHYCGCKYALAVTSATTGLTLAGVAVGIEPGDEVITTPVSWVATAMAFSVLGAKMVFCDVDGRTLNMDAEKLEPLIGPKTKAIVPVHLYGQCCRMDRIMEIAERHGVAVIDDCAHAPGAEYNGHRAGALGTMSVFSFHQQKNMGTLGEGGMITTSDKVLFDRALSYRSLCCRIYGGSSKYLAIDEEKHPMNEEYWKLYFDDVGYNFRMTDAQAAVGIEQLKKLDGHNQKRTALASALTERLKKAKGLTLPYVDPDMKHVWHLYLLLLKDDFPMSKREFMWSLYTEKGIKAWSHYMLIHLTDPYVAQGHKKGECTVAEAACERYVTLPIHPRLTDDAISYMADCIIELSNRNGRR